MLGEDPEVWSPGYYRSNGSSFEFWDFNEETYSYRFQLDEFLNDAIKKMVKVEEEAMLYVVIEYLRSQGYTVEEPQNEH